MPSLHDIETLVEQEKYQEAEAQLTTWRPEEHEQAEADYFRGMILERTARREEAVDAYQSAVQADEHHLEATFRLACLLDLYGDDQRAIELYERCTRTPPLHVNALLNLAVLYEDTGRNDEAARCLDVVLSEHPNNTRAQLFAKDVESSKYMYYDEDQERVREKRSAILDTLIGDFELSVRSRNCLRQMNLNTLGDLLRVTELQLMTYKNFGETSLNEIKTLLSQKGMRLGQLLEGSSGESDDGASALPTLGDRGVYGRPVTDLELSVRSRKCLQRLGIAMLGELAARSEVELLSIKNFGQTSLNEIKLRMADMGITLRP